MSLVVGLLVAAIAAPAEAPSPYVQRLRWQAQIQTLNADLLSHNSATGVLQSLCDRREPSAPRIRARRTEVTDPPEQMDEVRRALSARPTEPVKHRRVELTCADVVLSRADNWYLPGRLTPRMNAALDKTDTPFGVVVQELGFQRRTLSATLLFEPLPAGWARQPAAALGEPVSVPPEVLRHRAVLQTSYGRAFSLLVETYTDAVLVP